MRPPDGHAPSIVVLSLLLAVLAGCDMFASPPEPTADPVHSGLHGVVLLGPTCDAPSAASPCLEAYVARLVVFDSDGQVVGDVTSDPSGSFALTLPPGDYVIQPAPGGDPFPRAEAVSVSIFDGETTEVEIDYEARDREDLKGGGDVP